MDLKNGIARSPCLSNVNPCFKAIIEKIDNPIKIVELKKN